MEIIKEVQKFQKKKLNIIHKKKSLKKKKLHIKEVIMGIIKEQQKFQKKPLQR